MIEMKKVLRSNPGSMPGIWLLLVTVTSTTMAVSTTEVWRIQLYHMSCLKRVLDELDSQSRTYGAGKDAQQQK